MCSGKLLRLPSPGATPSRMSSRTRTRTQQSRRVHWQRRVLTGHGGRAQPARATRTLRPRRSGACAPLQPFPLRPLRLRRVGLDIGSTRRPLRLAAAHPRRSCSALLSVRWFSGVKYIGYRYATRSPPLLLLPHTAVESFTKLACVKSAPQTQHSVSVSLCLSSGAPLTRVARGDAALRVAAQPLRLQWALAAAVSSPSVRGWVTKVPPRPWRLGDEC